MRPEGGKDSFNVLVSGRTLGSVSGGDGNDSLTSGTAVDNLNGGSGNDAIAGGAGGDNLAGLAGNHVLGGVDGNYYLKGGQGGDTLTGGAMADSLIFEIISGNDTGSDLENGVDKFDIHAFAIDPANFVTAILPYLTDVAGGVLFDLGGLGAVLGKVTIQGIAVSHLDVSDFIF